jgi:hypothetical protein
MSLAIQDNEHVKPYVRFERIAVEDAAASLAAGHYVAKDVDMAYVTPPYSKDIMKYKVPNWLNQLGIDAVNGRIPADWVESYKKAYEAWKQGQELPLDGIPIKGWGVASPAQQETLIKLHILTVEQLSAVNDEGIRRIGMGGVDLKHKADAWLKSLKKSGGVAIEMAALKKDNEALSATVETLENKIKELMRLVEQSVQHTTIQAVSHGISAADLMDDE